MCRLVSSLFSYSSIDIIRILKKLFSYIEECRVRETSSWMSRLISSLFSSNSIDLIRIIKNYFLALKNIECTRRLESAHLGMQVSRMTESLHRLSPDNDGHIIEAKLPLYT